MQDSSVLSLTIILNPCEKDLTSISNLKVLGLVAMPNSNESDLTTILHPSAPKRIGFGSHVTPKYLESNNHVGPTLLGSGSQVI
jgi:hypothetical protein